MIAFTPEDEALRSELVEFLRRTLPAKWLEPGFTPPHEDGEGHVDFLRWWHEQLFRAGWAGAFWPKEYGGRGLSLMQRSIFMEEMARHKAPEPLGRMGLNLVGPTLIQFGNEEQKQRHLPKILNGEEIWCQGYSEPNAGSDLASLQTKAVLDGDDFVVNGQKVWTSFGAIADWCFLLVRTDPSAVKHKGITYILVDMRTPGITVRPLKQATGESRFSEVFFDNVRVPKNNVVGRVNDGWRVAVSTLSYERMFIGSTVNMRQNFASLVRLAKNTPLGDGSAFQDAEIRGRLARLSIELDAIDRINRKNLLTHLSGGVPGIEASMAKLLLTELYHRLSDLALELGGPYARLEHGSPYALADGDWVWQFFRSRASTIFAGTSEIQRNIIAERGLGLPK